MIARHLSETELSDYAGNELLGARWERAESHLQQCSTCAHTLQRLRETTECLEGLHALPPPPDLRQRVAAKLAIDPVPALSCRQAGGLLQEALDGVLSPFAAGVLQVHLDGCEACQRMFASLRQATEAVRSLPPVAAPDGVWQAVAAAQRVGPVRVPWGARLRPAWAGVAVAAAGGLYLLLHPVSQQARPTLADQPRAPKEIAAVQPAPAPRTTPEPAPRADVTRQAVRLRGDTSIARLTEPVRRPPSAARTSARETASLVEVRPEPTVVHPVVAIAAVTPVSAEPTMTIQPVTSSDTRPSARVLQKAKAVAKRGIGEADPHASFADIGRQLEALDSETLAAAPPAFPAGGATEPSHGRESGEREAPNRADSIDLTGTTA